MDPDPEALERELHDIGGRLAAALPSGPRRPMQALDARAMDLAASDDELRAALFRFVDVVPACHGVDDLARHLTAFLDDADGRPPPVAAALRMGNSRAGRAALGAAAAAGVRHMAHRFIVGSSPRTALKELRALWDDGIATSVDLLGEATVTQAEADAYAARCAEALDTLSEAQRAWPGAPRVNLSVKVSALTPLLRPDAPARGKADAAGRLRELLRHAARVGAHLHIDSESLDSREAILELVLELLAEEEFRAAPSSGLVLQAYLRDSPETLEQIVDWARATRREAPVVVRLVKGAYWDHEVVDARQHGWSVPVFEVKAESDRNFELLTRRLLDARPVLGVAIASHNLRSIAQALAYDRLSGSSDGVELQVLRGLGDDLGHALAATGHTVRSYCPVGDLVAGMAYLVRRLLENTSNESFLVSQASGASLDQLLAAP